MNKFPSINAIRSFEAVARLSSFVMAADELCVTHSAISKQIKQLEETVGVRLVNRTTTHVELTHEGQVYLPSARKVLGLISSAASQVQSENLSGAITISSGPAFATKWLIPRLSGFLEAFPKSYVTVKTSFEHENIYSSEIDIAIRYGQPTWQGRRIVKLFDAEIFPVCSPTLTHGKNALLTTRNLTNHVLLHDDEKQMWSRWLAGTGTTGIDGSRGHNFPCASDLIIAAEAGLGVAIGDSISCASSLRRGDLVRPFDGTVPAADSYYAIVADDDNLPALTEEFLRWLLQQVANFNAL